MSENNPGKKVKCAICGKEFNTLHKNVKYCSLECRAIGRAYKQRIWNSSKDNYMREYMREYRSKAPKVSRAVFNGPVEVPEN